MMAGITITSHVFIDTKLHGNRRCLWVVAVLRGTQDYSLHVHSQNNNLIALYVSHILECEAQYQNEYLINWIIGSLKRNS